VRAPVATAEPHVFEHHDRALEWWRRAGARSRVLVHVDAHHDLWWLDERLGRVSIANYVCQAIREGIVREVVWVVPSASFATAAARRALRRNLRALARQYGGSAVLTATTERMTARIGTTPIAVCTLASLPQIGEPVLLDVDTDFLILPRATFWAADLPCELPWLSPADLVGALRRRQVRAEVMTIAYSVEGGYTPLEWRYLGDELAAWWQPATVERERERRGFRLLLDATRAALAGQLEAADGANRDAEMLLKDSAAPLYQRARLLAARGAAAEARQMFARAAGRDPAYRTAYRSRGFPLLADRRINEAEAEFRATLALDPDDAYAHLGLARVALARSDRASAEAALRSATAANPALLDAHRDLGRLLDRQGRAADALEAYHRALALSLRGARSFDHPMAGAERADVRHGLLHAAVARLDARAARLRQAEAGYRMAVASGHDPLRVRLSLAVVIARRGDRVGAAREVALALAALPRLAHRGARRTWRRLVRRTGLILGEV
jgi:tetratricopeptide (TPR) repeat protein